MKTITIFNAYIQAKAIANTYGNDPWTGEPSYVKMTYLRKVETFRAALLARLEAGDRARERITILEEALADAQRIARENANECDRAREALREIEWVSVDFEGGDGPWNNICPWCKEYQDEGHAPDCQRQIALVLRHDRSQSQYKRNQYVV